SGLRQGALPLHKCVQTEIEAGLAKGGVRVNRQWNVYEHVLGLTDPENPVGRLVLYGGVPPSREMHDVIGGRDRQTDAARLRRKNHDVKAIRLGLKLVDHPLPGMAGNAAINPHWTTWQAVSCLNHFRETVLHGEVFNED